MPELNNNRMRCNELQRGYVLAWLEGWTWQALHSEHATNSHQTLWELTSENLVRFLGVSLECSMATKHRIVHESQRLGVHRC